MSSIKYTGLCLVLNGIIIGRGKTLTNYPPSVEYELSDPEIWPEELLKALVTNSVYANSLELYQHTIQGGNTNTTVYYSIVTPKNNDKHLWFKKF